MGRAPCCDKANVKKGPWSPEEDAKLKEFIEKYGTGGNWIALPQKAGLKRCGKSCRLRWLNYLRPNIKHGEFSEEEDRIICSLYATIGSRWSIIAAQLPGRTDNDIKNYWNTKLKKKLMGMMIPSNQRKLPPFSTSLQALPPQSQSLSGLSQLYRDCSSYYSQTKSLTGQLESSLVSPNLLYNNNNNLALATNNYSCFQMQDHNPSSLYNNMLMFGGGTEAASCSSSDGSCSQISYGKEIKQENNMGCHHQGYNISNCYEENQKFILDYGSNNGVGDQSPSPFVNHPQLQYDLEEVKQLISTSNVGCNNNNNNSISFCFNDENKTHEERGMYYYYY